MPVSLASRRSGDLATPCPVCRQRGRRTFGDLARCRSCGHRWQATSEQAHRQVEEAVYRADYAGYVEDPRLVRAFEELIPRLLAPGLPPDAEILDVGCGGGAFLAVATVAGYRARGLDVSPAAAELCRGKGLLAEAGDFLAIAPPAGVDAITMWDVLEHLREPARFVEHSRRLLRPGGLLIAKVPTWGRLSVGLAARIPRLQGTLLGAPEHVQYYTPRSLEALVATVFERFELSALPTGLRTPPVGGGWRKKAARRVRERIAASSGDGQYLVRAWA